MLAYVGRSRLKVEAEFRVKATSGDIMPRHEWSLASSRADAALTRVFAAVMIFAAVVGIAGTMHLHLS